MSSSRRRGRAPSPTVRTDSPAMAAPGIADVAITETSAVAIAVAEGTALDASASDGPDAVTDSAATPASETGSEGIETAADETTSADIAAAPVTGDDASSNEAAGPETAQAESAQADSADADAAEAVNAAPTPEPSEPQGTEQVEHAEQAQDAVGPVEMMAEAALLPPLTEAPAARTDAAAVPHGVRFGANFAFVPGFVPLSEINARLFAFARGEGEAALAHFQALAQAKSPAEAIRLQVTEMQRAADASLTCFSEIVRSANRLNGTAHRH